MFVNAKDLIAVELFWKKNEKNKNVTVLRNLDALTEDLKKTFNKVTFQMRPLNWGIYNDLQRESTVDKGTGDGEQLDWLKYKENKLYKILADWDAKDQGGNKIPITIDTIKTMHPLMAEFALAEYDKKNMATEE